MKPRFFRRMGFLTALACALGLGMGVPQRAVADEGDPPSRAARISYLNGSVSMQPAGAGDWTEAVVNRPMTTGDKLWTDNGARAELHAGAASIHLGERTGFSFLNLDDNTIQIRLTEGSINMRVRELRSGETYEIDTPNLAFTVTQAGDFRLDVNENGDVTNVTAFRGEGEVVTGGQNYTVHAGDRADFSGAENPRMETGSARGPDDLDHWAMDRDAREDHSVSSKYVSRDVTGYEDLDDHGVWRETPDYGPVWYPTVAVGWAPYRYGHWVWIDPWGWNWVEDEPWGFAPFHYGRWAFVGGSWGWCPGPFFARPFFAPALVGFVGGPHFFFGFGGPIGWFPLGFGEPFFPGFRCSRVFITNINITNTRFRDRGVLNNPNFHRFANQRVAGGITAVPRSTFVNSQSVARAALRGSAVKGMVSARATSTAAIAPNSRSVLGVRGAVNAHLPSPAALNRPVVTRSAPAPAAVPFSARQSALAKNPGRPLDSQTMGQLRAKTGVQGPAFRSANSARISASSSNRPSGNAATANGSSNTRIGQSSAPMPGRPATVREDRPPSASRGSMPSGRAQMDRSATSMPRATNRSADRPPANWNGGTSNSRASGGAQMDRSATSMPRATNRSADRPPANWNGGTSNSRASGGAQMDRSATSMPRATNRSADRPPTNWNGSSSGGRQSGRTYSSPTYSGRSYSAPSRSSSAPSRSYSAPSRSYSSGRSSGGGSYSSGRSSSSGRSNSGGGSYSAGRSSSGGGGSRGGSSGSSGRSSSGSSHGRH